MTRSITRLIAAFIAAFITAFIAAFVAVAVSACAVAPDETALSEHTERYGQLSRTLYPGDIIDATDDGRFAALLSAVPATEGALDIVSLSDFERARNGAIAPGPGAAEAEIEQWYRTVEQAARFWPVAFGGRHSDIGSWRDEIGFSIADVDASVEAGVAPDEIRAYLGVDPMAIDTAVTAHPLWSNDLERRQRRAGTLYGWGDRPDTDRAGATRLFGEAGQLLVDGDVAVRTSSAAVMDRVIATLGGSTRPIGSLADDPAVMEVASTLERLGVYSAVLSNTLISGEEEFYLSDRSTNASRQRWAGFRGSVGLLEPYELLGFGVARDTDDDALISVIVIANDSPETAVNNAEILRRTIEEGSSFRTGQFWRNTMDIITIGGAGSLTIAVVEPATVDGIAQAWLQRDSLFWVPYTL